MHQLHSALAFLFTRALSDYAAPAAELLLAHVHGVSPDGQGTLDGSPQQEWGIKTRTGYKLLVYLKCGLRGEAFPPGEHLAVPAHIDALLQMCCFALHCLLDRMTCK